MCPLKETGSTRHGFTIIELLVVISIIAILTALLLSSLLFSKAKSQSIFCRNNLRQLQVSWIMYADDHGGRICPNTYQEPVSSWSWSETYSKPGSWVLGNARNEATLDNITKGALFPYNKMVQIYHCPSDQSVTVKKPIAKRTRSYSLFGYLGNWDSLGVQTGIYPSDLQPFMKTKTSDILRPSNVLCFIPDAEQTMCCGYFWVDPKHRPITWIMVPTDRHDLGLNISYVDGHVEYHRWKYQKKQHFRDPVTNGDDLKDLRWIQERIPGAN